LKREFVSGVEKALIRGIDLPQTVYFRELQDEGIQTTATSYSEKESQSTVSKCAEVSEFNYSFTEFTYKFLVQSNVL
jgi:hypothetical protein